MNNLSRNGAQGFSHHEAQLGNVKLVSRVAMLAVTGCLLLFAEGCSPPDDTPSKAETPHETAAEKAKQEATRLAKLQPLIDEQMKLGLEAAGYEDEWAEAARAVAKVLEMDPDHAAAQELKRRVFWGPIPEKTSGNLKYKEHPTEPVCAISGAVDQYEEIPALPAQIKGRTVVRIGQGAFNGCSGPASVTIPSGVTSIGNEAFRYYGVLESVTIPSSVTSIGYEAFYGNHFLESVTIPSSVTSIGVGAFGYCQQLANLSVEAGNPSYQVDDDVLFTKGGKTLVLYPQGRPGETYTIPPSVTYIEDRAFAGCYELTSVTIPSSVTRIGNRAFISCGGLTSVMIPSSVTSMGYMAFYGCRDLTSVTISSNMTRIEEWAFYGCKALKSVTIPSSVTHIVDRAFQNCPSLTSVTIPSSVTSIGKEAFWGCSSLVSVTIPSSVTSIGGRAFSLCKKLASFSVAADNPCYEVDDGVLFTKGGTALVVYPMGRPGETYTIPTSVIRIEEAAFWQCRGLTSVTIPSSVISTGNRPFMGCKGLKSVTIPSSMTSIRTEAFSGCEGLTSVTISSGVAIIGAQAFNGCKGLKSVTIPSSVTRIEYRAFAGCSGLTSVTIPSSVTRIGEYAFLACKGLTSVTLPKGVKIGRGAFVDCPWQPVE